MKPTPAQIAARQKFAAESNRRLNNKAKLADARADARRRKMREAARIDREDPVYREGSNELRRLRYETDPEYAARRRQLSQNFRDAKKAEVAS